MTAAPIGNAVGQRSRSEDFGEPWHLFGYGQIENRERQLLCRFPFASEESGRRAVICVNLCAGLRVNLIESPAFRELILRAAKAMQVDREEPIEEQHAKTPLERLDALQDDDAARERFLDGESYLSQAMEGHPAQPALRDPIGEIEEIVLGILQKYGIVAEPEDAPERSAQGPAAQLRHIHTLSCYDDRGELLCGGAQ